MRLHARKAQGKPVAKKRHKKRHNTATKAQQHASVVDARARAAPSAALASGRAATLTVGDAGVAAPGAVARATAAAFAPVASPDVSVAEPLPASVSWASRLWRAVVGGATAPCHSAADDELFHILEWRVAKHGDGAYAAYERASRSRRAQR
jgi:hypothetical protein